MAATLTPIAIQRLAYEQVCRNLLEMELSPKLTYSENGRSVSWGEYQTGLLAKKKAYEETPGVVPEVHPVFDLYV